MRTPRSEAIKSDRRRRRPENLDPLQGMRLALPEQYQKDTQHHYRWVNDIDNGPQDHYNNDYDFVEQAKADGETEQVRRVVGRDTQGNPLHAVLMRKPMEYFREDQKAEDQKLRAVEQTLTRRPESDSAEFSQNSYVGASSIKHGGYTP